ncbi:MAG: thermosome subunit alpha [Candidatus Nitrosocaldus sp.]|nr:thermosome subunit alpha [Candidatus Nitrosocaldus sp.]
MAIPVTTAGGTVPVLILKEGAKETRGKEAQRNNITAAKLVAEIVKTSLGPRGMDKMLVDTLGDVTITNDGATILKEMDVQHPAAKMMVEISKATDNEVGDGTTSVVVLAGALLERAEELINKDVHPTIIVDGYNMALEKALQVLDDVSIKVEPLDKRTLRKIALTTLASKLVAEESGYLADLVIDAVLTVAEKKDKDSKYRVDVDNIKVEKKAGESLHDTQLIKGIVLDKEVVHGGMPKRVEKAKIALINAPLEIEKTEFDAKIRITSPEQMKLFLEEENRMLKSMVDKIVATGANVVICQKGIDDMAQHYLAKAGVLAVRRVKESDMYKLAKATGARVVTNIEELTPSDLGYADLVEERKVETDKWVFIEGCKDPRAVTILIRGGSQRVVDEADRSIHDAIMVVKDVVEKPYILTGGGAPEAFVAQRLREWANSLSGREQLAVERFAEALETIPLTLAENAGMDPIDTQVQLRSMQEKATKPVYGVNVLKGKVDDLSKSNICEPLAVKEQIISSAAEAAAMILRIDDIIAASKPKEEKGGKGAGGTGGTGGTGGMGME